MSATVIYANNPQEWERELLDLKSTLILSFDYKEKDGFLDFLKCQPFSKFKSVRKLALVCANLGYHDLKWVFEIPYRFRSLQHLNFSFVTLRHINVEAFQPHFLNINQISLRNFKSTISQEEVILRWEKLFHPIHIETI